MGAVLGLLVVPVGILWKSWYPTGHPSHAQAKMRVRQHTRSIQTTGNGYQYKEASMLGGPALAHTTLAKPGKGPAITHSSSTQFKHTERNK